MKKRYRKKIEFSNRILYSIISLVISIGLGVIVYAFTGISGVGHDSSDLGAPIGCSAGQFLQWDGSSWICATINVSIINNFNNNQTSGIWCGLSAPGIINSSAKLCDGFNPRINCPTGYTKVVISVDSGTWCTDLYGCSTHYTCIKN